MTGRRGHRAIVLFALGALAACWFVFAPPQLGGSTIYASTVGNSMEPRFHKGDLALVRPASVYRLHDVVLYESPVLHRPVLHRIVAIDDGRYYFKGDHNGFIDPGYATRTDLRGVLWFRMPSAGVALSFIGKPGHAGGLAGAAVLLMFIGGREPRRRRRRKMKHSLHHIHKPRHPVEDVATLALLAVTALALFVGFTTSTRRAVVVADAFRQSGVFSYSAATPRDAKFPTGVITTGQPIFLDDAKTVDILFRYHFTSRYAHGIRGTIGLSTRLSSDASTWHHDYVLAKARPFKGDNAVIRGTVPIKTLLGILGDLAVASGSPSDTFSAVLAPTIRIRGFVNDKPIDSTFAPTLSFSVNRALIKLDVAQAGPVAGATTAPASPASLLEAALEPAAPGTIPGTGPRTVSAAKTRVPVVDLRGIGIGLAGLLVLVIGTRPMRKRRHAMSPEERAAANAGCVVVGVTSLAPFGGTPVATSDFSSLVRLARYLERPILHDLGSGAYAVEDGGSVYLHHAAEPVSEAVVARVPKVAARRPFRWIGVMLVVVLAAGAVVTFTAANVVPVSNAGVSASALTLSQLAPPECAALNLTHLVVATGSSTSGPNGGDLILGRSGSGTFSLKGGSGNDCIVAGGGPGTHNTLDGGTGAGDICIGAPGAVNTFKNCEMTY